MANEQRLIDVSKEIQAMYSLPETRRILETDPVARAIIDRFIHAPTVDAVPVVHGRWEDAYGIRQSKCSNCGVAFGRVMDADCYYCPNCGAKMDGDGNEY